MNYKKYKRILDVVASLILLLLVAPVLACIAFVIKVSSPGSVLYRGIRAGLYGKPFRILKFRTMVVHADEKGGPSTALNDPRITNIGRILRKYKLDELPQLINILMGEMSFVGPRPQVTMYTNQYSAQEQIILSVRPGLTDWASIELIHLDKLLGDQNVDEKYLKEIEPRKNILRVKYARNVTPKTDIVILWKTFAQMFRIRSLWNTRT